MPSPVESLAACRYWFEKTPRSRPAEQAEALTGLDHRTGFPPGFPAGAVERRLAGFEMAGRQVMQAVAETGIAPLAQQYCVVAGQNNMNVDVRTWPAGQRLFAR